MKGASKGTKVIIAVMSTIVVASLLTLFLYFAIVGSKPPKPQKLEFHSLEIAHNGVAIESFDAEVQAEDFSLDVIVNGGVEFENTIPPTITWKFVGETDSHVTTGGVIHVGNTIQTITLVATATGENELSASIQFNIIPKAGTTLQSISAVTKEGATQEYIEGQMFDSDTISVWGYYGSYYARLIDFTVPNIPLTSASTDVLIKYGDKEFSLPVSVKRKTLQSIDILSLPNKVNYIETQTFDKTGLKIRANYEYLHEEVNEFVVDETKPLGVSDKAVVISYTFNGVTKTTSVEINVTHRKLVSITLSGDVRKQYVQGAKFSPTGLKVVANYEEVASEEVQGYTYPTTPLMSGKTQIEIEYTENGITKSAVITGLTVEAPYFSSRHIKILSSENLSLSWTYKYINDNLEEKTDYNTYAEHSYAYDVVGGEYDVPVGAIVTFTATNSTVSGLKIGQQQVSFDYPSDSYDVEIFAGDEVQVDAVVLPGDRFVVRFAGTTGEHSFVYGKSWSEPLRAQDYKVVGQIFTDAANKYYTYRIGETNYTYAELKDLAFTKKTVVVVTEVRVETETKVLTLNYYDGMSVVLNENVGELSLSDIDAPNRVRYTFLGWATEENGTPLSDQTFKDYLNTDTNNYELFALWESVAVDYADSQYVGLWSCDVTIDEKELTCSVEFKADGTFSYTVNYDGSLNNSYTGYYEINADKIIILEINCPLEMMLVAPSDFEFVLDGENLQASVFIIENYAVSAIKLQLDKA